MLQCEICGDEMPQSESMFADMERVLDHIRVMHPDQYVEAERWPDGSLIVEWDVEPTQFFDGWEGV